MSYKALLFCPDEKTARTVTQVLTELDFSVEASGEPFGAVKKLTSEHFDALVVDGDNQQNASLLFKTAHNSGLNQNSLAVAIVEGQSGVAKAFQIGANLVLTKPINVEQSKGTLRVARGLLRKTEAAKLTTPHVADQDFAAESSAAESKPMPALKRPPVAPPPASLPMASPALAAASPSALFEVESEPSPEPEPTEAALLESMPDPTVGRIRKPDVAGPPPVPKPSPWQPVSQPMAKPMATALKHADQALGKPSGSGEPVLFSQVSSGGAAAAAAPAREVSRIDVDEEIAALETPKSWAPVPVQKSKPTGLVTVLIVVAVCAVGYFGWTRIHARAESSAHKTSPVQTPAPVLALSLPQNNPVSTPATEPYSAVVTASPLPPTAPTPAPVSETPAPTPKKTVTNIAVSDGKASSAPKPEVLVVSSEASKPAPPPVIAQVDAEPAPEASIVSSSSGESAVSGLVEMPASTPHPAPHTLRISQGVSQGLLIKKVAPAYPQSALAMRIQGAVQLLATIGSDGNVSNVKLLSGDTLLSRAAMDAVKQWKYKPYYLNDKPLEIQTEITVNFTLPQ
jgi:periplasmic protein TonB